MIKIKKFIKSKQNKTELIEVFIISKKLEKFLNEKNTAKKISELNVKSVVSQKIQAVIEEFAIPELGFSSEKENLFRKYETNKLRPDLYKKIGKSGILLEVEKGKTVTNNTQIYIPLNVIMNHGTLFIFISSNQFNIISINNI